MDAKRREYVSIFIIMTLIFFMSGCAKYGKLRVESRNVTHIASSKSSAKYSEKMTIDKLVNNWKDYDIYYAGYRADRATGIMFDPKEDDLRLLGDWWEKIDTKESLEFVLKWINFPRTFYEVIPLYRMIGPGDKVYGYMYTPFTHVTFKQVDEKSMYVFWLEWTGWGWDPGVAE
jgi:hypothetical protein